MSVRTVEVDDAGSRLAELIEAARAGDEVVITRDHLPVATIQPVEPPRPRVARRFGSAADLIIRIAEDFDEPLEDFEPYMR